MKISFKTLVVGLVALCLAVAGTTLMRSGDRDAPVVAETEEAVAEPDALAAAEDTVAEAIADEAPVAEAEEAAADETTEVEATPEDDDHKDNA